jgi:poly(hydroxyalkanoate) granule-associated protein
MAATKRTSRKANPLMGKIENLRADASRALDALQGRAEDAREGTVAALSRLEKAFQQRVSAAVVRLGIPQASEVRALSRQVARLQRNVEQLRRSRARA